jgi:hypothetical protein
MSRIADIVGGTKPRDAAIWSGAGVSREAPTSAPLGDELASRALEHAFQPDTAAVVEHYYRALALDRRRPRLETLLDVVARVHGAAALVDVLGDLREAPYNDVHRFLAAHLLAGGHHVTTNFDSCLEAAAEAVGGSGEVVHVHGSFAADWTGQELGATLARVELGLPAEVRAALDRVLLAEAARLVVFVGYSGSDFFDVDPYLRALPPDACAGKRVVWVDHREAAMRVLAGAEAAAARRQLGWLRAAGAAVWQLECPTLDALGALAATWGLQPPRIEQCPRRTWAPQAAIGAGGRRRASLELYALMGLHREVARLFVEQPPADPGEWRLLAATRWAEGRYRAAAKAWRRAFTADEWAAAAEREAAGFWIRGRYRAAARRLVAAIRRAEETVRAADGVSLEQRLVLAETLARVWAHARRYPDSRRLASEGLRRFTLARLPDPAALDREGQRLGTHLRARVASARAGLGAGSADFDDSVAAFGEYEALAAELNYRHGRLREAAARGPVRAEAFRRLHHDATAIGAIGDAARIVFLPGAEAAFSPAEVGRALLALDVTSWHRLRLVLARFRPHARLGRY